MIDYIEFASKISFFEFNEEEFEDVNFNINEYSKEISLLKEKINIERLTNILGDNPKVIDIFEEIFQLMRFSNTQLIHFCFDVNLINNGDEESIINYFNKSVVKFENGTNNEYFLNFLNKNLDSYSNKEKIYYFKRAINDYISNIIKDKNIFYNHIKNSICSRIRISRYLIENLKADEYIEKLDIEAFLKLKRKPKDIKSIHGKFGSNKIRKILNESNFICLNNIIKNNKIDINSINIKNNNNFFFITEKSVDGILKEVDKKPKKFDFILFINNAPEYLIETNFYTTEGTKIGINENEYIILKQNIENFNKKNNCNLKFIWITDGNYWLTNNGMKRFKNLKDNFFKNDYELLNINLFKEFIKKITFLN